MMTLEKLKKQVPVKVDWQLWCKEELQNIYVDKESMVVIKNMPGVLCQREAYKKIILMGFFFSVRYLIQAKD